MDSCKRVWRSGSCAELHKLLEEQKTFESYQRNKAQSINTPRAGLGQSPGEPLPSWDRVYRNSAVWLYYAGSVNYKRGVNTILRHTRIKRLCAYDFAHAHPKTLIGRNCIKVHYCARKRTFAKISPGLYTGFKGDALSTMYVSIWNCMFWLRSSRDEDFCKTSGRQRKSGGNLCGRLQWSTGENRQSDAKNAVSSHPR